MEVYSPGGMMDGSLIQHLNPMNVPSKRRNPLLADFFNRLNLMERRGSGMKKIVKEYKHFEKVSGYKAPEFKSNSGEFHVTLWNLNYISKVISSNPKTTTVEMATTLNISTRQVQKYLKRLTEQNLIVKEGNSINGLWKILDKEYTDFFEHI